MKEHYNNLLLLLEKLPRYYSKASAEQAEKIASQYEKILRAVMASGDNYSRDLEYWPGELKDIQQLLHDSLWQKWRKEERFNEAKRHLKDDIKDLAARIKFHEGFSEKANLTLDDL
jgi:hypothetical protein